MSIEADRLNRLNPSLYHRLSPVGGMIGSALTMTAFGIDASVSIFNNASYPPEHVLVFPAILAASMWGGIITPALYRRAVDFAIEADEKDKALEAVNPPVFEHTGGNLKNGFHLLLMWAPNIFHPKKLLNNLRHPIGEVLHTRHEQYSVEGNPEVYAVEHELFGRLVTVDIVRRSRFPKPLLLRMKQLFNGDFYYGHAEYFPEAFRLIDRTFVEDGANFDVEGHVKKIVNPPTS